MGMETAAHICGLEVMQSEGMYKTRQEIIMHARSRLHDHAVGEKKKT